MVERVEGAVDVGQAENAAGNAPLLVAQAIVQPPEAAVPDTGPGETEQRLVAVVDEGSVVRLPEGASIDQPRVNGTDLEFVQADGSVIVVPNGAVQGLTIMIGAVEIPPQTVAALFAANDIQAAAGPAGGADVRGSGGNFEVPVGGIGNAFPIGTLLDPTALAFGSNDDRPYYEGLEDSKPTAGARGLALLDDDDLAGGNPGGLGDDASGPRTGTLAHDYGFNGGASLLLTGAGLPAGLGFSSAVSSDGLVLTISQDGTAVLRITLSDTTSGNYVVEQLAAIRHPGAGEDNVAFDITYRVTDSDGDVADGGMTINVDDDTPEVAVGVLPSTGETGGNGINLVLDESFGPQGADVNAVTDDVNGSAFSNANLTTDIAQANAKAFGQTATAIGEGGSALAALFTSTVSLGADGGTIAHQFALALSGSGTGGVQTNLAVTAVLGTVLADPATDRSIYLFTEADGSITGRIGGADGLIALRISLANASDPGSVSLVVQQLIPLAHGNVLSMDEAQLLSLIGGESGGPVLAVTYTVTATDGDGDVASQSASVTLAGTSGGSISFEDDGPTLSVGVTLTGGLSGLQSAVDETIGTDRTNGAGEVAHGLANDDDITAPIDQYLGRSTTSIGGTGLASLFTVGGSYGSDGGSDTSTLSFVGIPTGIEGVATNLSATVGGAITLFLVDATTIEGRTAGGVVVFDIKIVDGQLQTTLYQAISHSDANQFDSTTTLELLEGSSPIQLQYTVTRTDGDGDSVTESATVNLINHGGSYFSFDDDGPTLTVGVTTSGTITGLKSEVDESTGTDRANGAGEVADGNTDDGAGYLGRSTTAIGGAGLTSLFTVGGSYGADGGSDTGTLSFVGIPAGTEGVATNLSATVGGAITLFQVDATTIEGRTAGGTVVFDIKIVGGQVQTTLYQAIAHTDANLFDSTATLELLAGSSPIQLQYSVTRIDGDGDTITEAATVDLITTNGGPKYFSFDDDGPIASNVTLSAIEGQQPLTGTLTFAPGADGAVVSAVNGQTLTFGTGGWSQWIEGGHGMLRVKAGGEYEYKVQGEDPYVSNGADNFTYTVRDGDGDTAQALITVTVADKIQTNVITLDDVTVNEAGTVVYTAHMNYATTQPVTIMLSNGVTITFNAGQLTAQSTPQAAQGDDVYKDGASTVINITGISPHNFEAVNITDTGTVTITDTVDTVTATLTAGAAVYDATGVTIAYTIALSGAPGSVVPTNGPLTFTLADGTQIVVAQNTGSGTVSVHYAYGSFTTPITNAISSAAGGDEYEHLATAGSTSVVANTVPTVTDGISALTVKEAALDTNKDGSDLAAGTVTGTTPTSTAETAIDANTMVFHATGEAITSVVFANPAVSVPALSNLASGTPQWALSEDGRTLTLSFNGQPALILALSGSTGAAAGADATVSITATLTDNFAHLAPASVIDVILSGVTVIATDLSGDQVTGTVSVNIVDDAPVLVADTDTLPAGVFTPATGNVLTDAAPGDAGDSDNGADNLGADGGTVVGVAKGDTGAALVSAGSVGSVIYGYHGQLTLLADGSYTYVRNPSSSGGVSDVFTYTVRDSDGDLAYTTLTISIDNSTPTLSNLTPSAEGGDVIVHEDDLLATRGAGESAGSDTSKESTTVTGSFTVTSADGVKVLSIGNLQVIADGTFTAGSIATPLGNTFTVSAYNAATGVVTYSYTLNNNETHANGTGNNSLFEELHIELLDYDQEGAYGTLTVNIVDDVPVLTADTDSLAAGVFTPATGNVLTDAEGDGGADILGADGGAVVGVATGVTGPLDNPATVGAVINGLYGQLTLLADGSYSYVRNPGSAGGVNDVFTYTVKDGDGDLAQTTLTISIGNSTPEIGNLTPAAANGDVTVYENALNVGTPGGPGSTPASTAETASGTFSVTSADGIKSLTVGGLTVITNGIFIAGSITTPLGNTLAVTAYDAATGVVTYSYTLTDNETHANAAGTNSLFENLTVALTDQDDQSTSATLSVNIVDDVPVLAADTDSLAAGVFTPATGNVLTDASAGDAGDSDNGADPLGADGGSVVGVAMGATSATLDNSATVGAVINGLYGQLTLLADGSYSYVRNPGSAGGVNDVFTYTVKDGDGDLAQTTLTISIGNSTPTITNLAATNGDVTVYEDDLLGTRGTGKSAGSDTSKESTTVTGDFTITAADGVKTLTVHGVTVIANGTLTGTLVVTTPLGNTLTVTGYNAATGVVTYSYTLNDNETHANADGNNSVLENLAVVLTDQDNQAANGTLGVNIVDDIPAVDFVGATSVNEDATGTVGGSYLFRAGADGILAGSIAIAIGGSVIATVSAADLANGETIVTTAGQLVLSAPTANGGGTWTFDPAPVAATTTVNISISLTDNDGDIATDTHSITVNNVNGPLVISGAIIGTVEEEHGLPGGNEDQTANPDNDADTAGNLNATTNVASGSYAALVTGGIDGALSYAFAVSGNPAVQTVSNGALRSGGQPVLFALDAGGNLIGYVNNGAAGYQAGTDTKVFTMTLDPSTGAYTFTLNAPVDHPINSPATEDSIAINLNGYVTVTDAGGPSPGDTARPLNGSITVIDDTPIANNDVTTLDIVVDELGVSSIGAAWTNIDMSSGSAVTIDRDGDGLTDEIRWPNSSGSGYGFVDNPALTNLPVSTNETFSLGTFTHFNFPVNGGTLESTTLSVTFTAIINGELVQVGPILINFEHTETDNNGTAEQNRDIISIATSTATVNIEGQNYTLDVRGFVDTNGQIVSTVRTYENAQSNYQLAVRFVSSDSTSVTKTGNVMSSSDSSGADLPLVVSAIQGVTTDTTADGSGNFQVDGLYGTLVINRNGTYTYTLTDDASHILAGASEIFTYTVKDGDGDPASATLKINLNKVDSAANPLHGDRVLTNISGGAGTDIAIAAAALLHNDDAGSTVNGTVTSVTDATSVINAGGNYVFKDNDTDGGKFTYNGQNGALADNAIVTVDRAQAGSTTLTGTSFGEILIGRDVADTINGGGGDDYIIANGGDDTIDGGTGADVILAGAGNDIIIADQADTLIDGGADNDTLRVGGNFVSASDAQIANIENVTLTAAATLNLSNQTESFTITGSSGVDSITAGSGNDTIIAAQNDALIDGGAGTDTLRVGANFTSANNGQIANVENVLLTGAATLNLANQTEAFAITGSSGNDTITGGSGADSISAGDGNDTIFGAQNDVLLDGGNGNDTLSIAGSFTSSSDAQVVNIENITLTSATTLNLSNQTEGFTITGSSGADTITGGSGNDTIIAAQNDTLIDGGAGTDTLQIGGAFTSTSNGQIVNVENIVLTSTAALNLSNQTEGFAITANSGGNTIIASTGADKITINAGTSETDWSVNLGNDTAADKIIFNHAGVNGSNDTVATVSNFNVLHDKIAITVGGTNAAAAGFQQLTATGNVIVPVGSVVELVSSSWVSTSLGNDGNNSTIEGFIQAATTNFAGGVGIYTFILYSSTNTATASAGIYSVTIGDDTNPNQNGMVVEHIMTLTGVGYGNLTAANFAAAADPIVLDLDGNGYGFSPLAAGAAFDLDGNAAKDQVAWNSSNDGLLAYDANGNGVVDNGTELFTPWFNGGKFANGSAALASLDSNGDGFIDAQDEAFSKLSIWQDANGDGVTDAGELKSLTDHGITSLSAGTSAASGEVDGQAIVGEGTFTRADGSTGGYVEVELEAAFGAAESQTLVADDYGDILTGGHGDDILIAGLGADTLSGGAGNDTFTLGEGEGADTITDYVIGDVVDLSDLLPGAVGNEGDVQFKYADGSTKAINETGGGVEGDVTIQVHDTSGWHDVAVIKDTGSNLSGVADSINLILDDNQTVKIFDI